MSKWIDRFRAEAEGDDRPEKRKHAQDNRDKRDKSPVLDRTGGKQTPIVANVPIVLGIDGQIQGGETDNPLGLDVRGLLPGTPDNLPVDWVDGTCRILAMAPPSGWRAGHWRGTQNLSRWLLRLWAERLVAAGWGLLNIYGVDPASPYMRMDKSGLLFALPGGVVADIYRKRVEIVMSSGERRTHHKKPTEGLVPVFGLRT